MSHANGPQETGPGRHGDAPPPHVPRPPHPPRPPHAPRVPHGGPPRPYGSPPWRAPHSPAVPGPPPPPVPIVAPATSRGVGWALVPLLTFGYGTPFSFMYAAIKRGSWGMGAAATGYGAGLMVAMASFGFDSLLLSAIGSFLMMLLWIGGTGHALAARTRVFPKEPPRNLANEHAVEVARFRRTLRDEARELAARDPALARELRIGRPDEPRTYDDGGLVDVNHAPPNIIAALPGMTPELAERVIERRAATGPFISVEEMVVDADLPPDVLPQLADFAIFLP
ncbi:ComEA family DNA-binding protein [Actinomadura sp. LOL_016]|uniref:ComEA family DNA-binding protein n=1 Tax=unclassified Actinomadura TaxID=2626254 RepID=UPI003A810A91